MKKKEQQKLSLEATYYLYCNVKQEEEDVARSCHEFQCNKVRNIWFLSPLVTSKREKNKQTETT